PAPASGPPPANLHREHAPDRPTSRLSATTLRSFRCCNQLKEFLRIVQPLLEFGPKRLGGDLCRNRDFSRGRIRRYKLYFVDPDRSAFPIAQSLFDLLGDILPLGTADGKRPHQAGEILYRDLVGKIDAG